jgi:hypothetical protein
MFSFQALQAYMERALNEVVNTAPVTKVKSEVTWQALRTDD